MEFARQFRADLDEVHQALISVPPKLADVPWREGGWTRKQIVGHMLDYAPRPTVSTKGQSIRRMRGWRRTVTRNTPGRDC